MTRYIHVEAHRGHDIWQDEEHDNYFWLGDFDQRVYWSTLRNARAGLEAYLDHVRDWTAYKPENRKEGAR